MNAKMNTKILKGYDSYILWGALDMGEEALKQFREEGLNVIYFCDSDSAKWGKKRNGVPVIGPGALSTIVEQENALIIICSSYAKHVIASTCDDIGLPYVYFSKPIFVEITSFCNQSCFFCPYEYIEREKQNIDFELVKSFLYDLRSEKSDVLFPLVYPHVLGEPLVSKDFWNFLDLCKELKIYACVVTNFALMDETVQERLFTNYPDLDIVLSIQGPTENVFSWRSEKKLTHEQWINRVFEIVESKFKYGHKGLIQLCTICPDVVNNTIVRSEENMNIFQWYDSMDDFRKWKREFGGRCLALADEIKRKYPENYEAAKVDNPVLYYYNLKWLLTDLDAYVNEDGPAQFGFLPNVHIYGKKFGVWCVENFFGSLLPEDKYFYYEENWFARSERCDRVGDVSLLSSGQLVMCNIDNEAEYVFADLRKGEKYTDALTQKRIKNLRDNLTLARLCRKCRARAHVFDTTPLEAKEQIIMHYGMRWHKKRKDAFGIEYRPSYDYSYAYTFPRFAANVLEIDLKSLQTRKHHVMVKIMSYDDATKLFTEEKVATFVPNIGEQINAIVPFEFKVNNLYRIDIHTPTQNDVGAAVYSMRVKREDV